eukprot:COSAG02_NODE_3325_length_6935_cov_28.660913_7_plen_84_part_00
MLNRSVRLRAFADVRPEFSMGTVPIAISVETSAKAPIPGRAVIERSIQRSLSRTRTVALGILRAAAADSGDSAWESVNSQFQS